MSVSTLSLIYAFETRCVRVSGAQNATAATGSCITLADAKTLTDELSFDDVNRMRDAVPSRGLQAPAGKRDVLALAKDVLSISHKGLTNRGAENAQGFDENHFLAPLDEVVALGETQAERLLKQFSSNWDGDIDHIFEEYAY